MLKNLETLLKDKGYKITTQRRAILQVFTRTSKHLLTAAEVYGEIEKCNKKINFSTVYRNLEVLWEAGIIKKVNLGNGVASYELSNGQEHHHHLICLKCGEAERISYCPMADVKDNIKKFTDFLPIDHNLEIYGYCGRCKNIIKI